MSDLISRQAAIEKTEMLYRDARDDANYMLIGYNHALSDMQAILKSLPSVQPEPLSDAYTKAGWTWLLEYQIKAAELKGRYTPYEVLSWVTNDWRKEHERSD